MSFLVVGHPPLGVWWDYATRNWALVSMLVTVTFLGWSLTTPRALMIIVVLLLGIILGWIAGSLGRRKRSH